MASSEHRLANWEVLKYLEEHGFEYNDNPYPHHILYLGDLEIHYHLFEGYGTVFDYTQPRTDGYVGEDMSIQRIMDVVATHEDNRHA